MGKVAFLSGAGVENHRARPLDIAVIGSGISGLSAAWLLSGKHRVTLYEADSRIGGHSHTQFADGRAIDTGFIVYNQSTYPNLTAMFDHLGVASAASDMGFAVSLDDGRFEYSGSGLAGLFAQRRNMLRPRFWQMLRDLVRFYRQAPRNIAALGLITLDEYLDTAGFGEGFRNDHLYPMAAAIWSTPAAQIGAYPAAAFIRFCENHGLLKFFGRPQWRTVAGGSQQYVARLAQHIGAIVTNARIGGVDGGGDGADIIFADGARRRFDHIVLATHADQALALLARPSAAERATLSPFTYIDNVAVLHKDASLMPRRRRVWSSWNYMTREAAEGRRLAVTYWMNRLQNIDGARDYFVTLNPHRTVAEDAIFARTTYGHPYFDARAIAAQQKLWALQGQRNLWFCGAYFGAGFHEDGLQAGLAVAEALGGVQRPWQVANPSGRICMDVAPPGLVAA